MKRRQTTALLVALAVTASMLCAIAAAAPKKEPTYYELLGVKSNADEKTIKKAFKKLALQYHPDKIQGTEEEKLEAQKKFAVISNAYEVLTDSDQRQKYDMSLRTGQQFNGGREPNFRQGGGDYFQNMGGYSQFFENMFGGFGGGGFKFNFGGQDAGGDSSFGFGRNANRGSQQQREQEKVKLFDEEALDHRVINLNLGTLSQFYQRREAWVLFLYARSKASQLTSVAQAVREASFKYKEWFRVGAVDCEKNAEICEDEFEESLGGAAYKVIGYPRKGGRASKRALSVSADVKSMSEFASGLVPNNATAEIATEKAYLEAVASSDGKHIVILFTERGRASPMYNTIADEFEARPVKFYYALSTSPLAKKFKVRASPSTLVVVRDAYEFQADVYGGADLKRDAIKDFLKQHVSERVQAAPVARLTPQLVHDAGVCSRTDSKLCFIVLIDDSQTASRQDAQRADLREISKTYAREQVRFFYLEQRSTAQALRATHAASALPTMIVVKGKRQQYVASTSAPTYTNMNQFLQNILDGSSSGYLPLKNGLADIMKQE